MGKVVDTLKSLGWLGTALVTVVGAIWIAITYFNEQRLTFAKTFSEKQLELSFQAANTVGGLVAARNADEWDKLTSQFWNLYLGGLVLFESEGTATAMGEFGRELDRTKFEERQKLRPYALHVSKSLRDFIAERNRDDWRITFDTLTGL